MEPINERFRELRERLNLSQKEFGEKIGLSNSGISNIENGQRNVTARHIKLLCVEFPVNEEWLRTGKGPMLLDLRHLISDYSMDSLDYALIATYLRMSPTQREVIKSFFRSVASLTNVASTNPLDYPASTEYAVKVVNDYLKKQGL